MAFFFEQIAKLHANHPVFFALLCVPLVTIVANAAIYFFTSPSWATILTNNPRVAALMKILQAVGVDPVSLCKWVYTLFTGKQWGEPPAAPKAPKPLVNIVPPAALLALVAELSVAALGCPKCPTTPPPASAEASAILLRVQDASTKTSAAMSAATKVSARAPELDAHLLKLSLSPGSFWCDAASLYDELAALEQEVANAEVPIPPQLTEAIALVKWSLDRITCECALPPAGT